jgi:hypothetical protein
MELQQVAPMHIDYVPRSGVVSARSTSHPLRSLDLRVWKAIPVDLDQSTRHLISPLKEILLLSLLFLLCIALVAHRQFSLLYPRLLSILSKDIPDFGSPISLRKLSNDSHSSHTVIPLFPYLSKEWWFLFLHLVSIPHQILCNLVRDFPCVVLSSCTRSSCKQPQDFVFPLRMLSPLAGKISPQVHKQSHINLPLTVGRLSTTVIRLNVAPIILIFFAIFPFALAVILPI